MEKRVAVIGIVVEKEESAETVNAILHEYRDVIVGRMGIPYRELRVLYQHFFHFLRTLFSPEQRS